MGRYGAIITCTASKGGFTLNAVVVSSGKDLSVTVFGGDVPHIGSVSVALPRPSLTGIGTSATVSTFNVTGHMDNYISDPMAKELSAVLGCVCSVSCGFHCDVISREGIETVIDLGKNLTKEILCKLKAD